MRPRPTVVTVLAALLMLTFAGLSSAPGQGKKKAQPGLRAQCDRADALYRVGDEAAFLVTSQTDGPATYRLSEDGHATVKEGKLELKAGETQRLTGTLKKPGFLLLQVRQGLGFIGEGRRRMILPQNGQQAIRHVRA